MLNEERMNRVEQLATVFMQDIAESKCIMSRLNTIPRELKFVVLVSYVSRAMRGVRHPVINKEELLLIIINRSHRTFDSYLSNIVGRARVYGHLDIIANTLKSAYFNEKYYNMTMVLSSNLGFEPTLNYMQKLKFEIVDVNTQCT